MNWIRVGWLFSMARSGTSIACYAAASPWGHPVCDEPFGPWDRTGPPFYHPAVQKDLMEAFAAADQRLTADVLGVLNRLLNRMGGRTGYLVCKIPHLHPAPAEIGDLYPHHGRVLLIRNPLHRLNSLFARGWTASADAGYDLDRFRAFAERWLAEPVERRLVYDDIRDDPETFFRKMYLAWDWPHEDEDVRRAAAYCRGHYHHRSKRVDRGGDPTRVVSERRLALPVEAVEAYLGDPFVVDLMRRVGWSARAEDYLDPAAARRAANPAARSAPGAGAPGTRSAG